MINGYVTKQLSLLGILKECSNEKYISLCFVNVQKCRHNQPETTRPLRTTWYCNIFFAKQCWMFLAISCCHLHQNDSACYGCFYVGKKRMEDAKNHQPTHHAKRFIYRIFMCMCKSSLLRLKLYHISYIYNCFQLNCLQSGQANRFFCLLSFCFLIRALQFILFFFARICAYVIALTACKSSPEAVFFLHIFSLSLLTYHADFEWLATVPFLAVLLIKRNVLQYLDSRLCDWKSIVCWGSWYFGNVSHASVISVYPTKSEKLFTWVSISVFSTTTCRLSDKPNE